MKILFANPPVKSLPPAVNPSSECIFQFAGVPGSSITYPVLLAEAATLLHKNKFQIMWKDALAENINHAQFIDDILDYKPDAIAIKSSMPFIKKHGRAIAELRESLPEAKFMLIGAGISAAPEQSLQFSGADYVFSGGDYDLLLLNLCRHLRDGTQLDGSIRRYQEGHVTGGEHIDQEQDPNALPVTNRELTCWETYSTCGGFRYHPGARIMSARGCTNVECKFCPASSVYQNYRAKSPARVVEEIIKLVDRYGVQEIIDSSYTFPRGDWLHSFCGQMISSGYNEKIKLGCSLQAGAVDRDEYNLMFESGFRSLSFGLPSATQKTLLRLEMTTTVDQITQSISDAKKAGLSPAVTAVVGYPWERYSDARHTVKHTRSLFEKGIADVVRGRVLIPYPGIPFYSRAVQNGWINGDEWQHLADYPDRELPGTYPRLLKLVHRLEWLQKTPLYFMRRIGDIRTTEDFRSISREMKGAVTPKPPDKNSRKP